MLQEIVIPLLAGLALFLFGMKVMELALHNWAGPQLKHLLERFTKTPLRGMAAGTVLTAFLQSSSAITVITIGLVNAGILTFPRTLGIILGTNIGSCFTTELIGLRISHMAVPVLICFTLIWLFSCMVPEQVQYRSATLSQGIYGIRYFALAVCGFSLVLFGIEVMQTIVPSLQSRGLLTWFLELSQRSLLWGVLAGAVLTAIIHSSAATIAITMGLASVHMISLDLGIAIILGANIGTCSTALIASFGGSKHGYYLSWSHIILNAGGALLFIPLIAALHDISAMLSSNPAHQIAHAQTIFNIVCSLLALPFCYLRFFRELK